MRDPIAVWTGNKQDSMGTVFKFDGIVRESQVGGRFITRTFGKLWPKSQKWAYIKGESKSIILEGAQIKFNNPPYIVRIHTPKKGQPVSFAKSVMRYQIIDYGKVKKAKMVWEQQQSSFLFEAGRVELLDNIIVEINGKRSGFC